jgi:hypothetical protein
MITSYVMAARFLLNDVIARWIHDTNIVASISMFVFTLSRMIATCFYARKGTVTSKKRNNIHVSDRRLSRACCR